MIKNLMYSSHMQTANEWLSFREQVELVGRNKDDLLLSSDSLETVSVRGTKHI